MRFTLVADINSGRVSTGLAINTGSTAGLHAQARERFARDHSHEDSMLRAFLRALKRTFHVGKDKTRGVDNVLISLSSPWVRPPVSSVLHIESNILPSSLDKSLQTRLEKAVHEVFGVRSHVRFKNLLPLYFETYPEKFNNLHPMVVVSHGAHVSDAMLVSGGVIRDLRALDLGEALHIHKLGDHLGLPHDISESMLSLYSRGELMPEVELYISNLLSEHREKEKEILNSFAPNARVYALVDDPLVTLSHFSTRLG